MAEHVIRLPDVGEGIAEAELVEWHVKIGDVVREDAVLAAVMTDKATVEIPSPVDGEVLWLGAEVGAMVAVGAPLVRLKTEGEGLIAPQEPLEAQQPHEARPLIVAEAAKPAQIAATRPSEPVETKPTMAAPRPAGGHRVAPGAPRPEGEKPLASPAVRLRAREAGIDLRQVAGTGPANRITHADLDAFMAGGLTVARTARQADTSIQEVKVIGLRRRIAEKMALAKSRIPHITYVEEVDVTALEELRAALNRDKRDDRPRLTLIPFLMRAMVRAIAEQPGMNALFDDEAGVIAIHGGVHIGIATQTPAGLVVPVVRHAEARDLWDCAAETARLAEAARAGLATREELTGSTITITSLGALGGIATTPVINHPEVAIVGVNKIAVRPVWDGSQFIPRKMMNLSSSFDHRVVDGWDAAVFVQRIKALLETPAMIFMET
ncbi:dihydrolipoamide acetyltransferase family protein [Chelatococcus sp. SYSU_G07232]|uniref:Dihydrolipoamide acetyltransferase component of pyruvate dehydrogenase complex n=1 Tax=Chelatococcus albus TaxID=3047466 RepID=A0ABT7AKQ7_9HYPH|nr:dihydrolipoamide acetyltransferase family protein [Chelatococcus sp. SYSU_G07232]MDJ1159957.1 dihydrolipoamide acetyltransferase family protein [Chelatococcus sp. SYSU_G07232]